MTLVVNIVYCLVVLVIPPWLSCKQPLKKDETVNIHQKNLPPLLTKFHMAKKKI